MRSVIFSAAATLGVVAFGMTAYQANAQVVQPPRQDCQQLAGIQNAPGSPQDQSCNTVYKDPDLLSASIGVMIQSLVDASPSLPDGPFIRVDLPAGVPNHLDYLTLRFSVNSGGVNAVGFPADGLAGSILSQIGFDPGVTVTAEYEIVGDKITITDTTTNDNQILNGCPDGVALVKNGGKNQTVTVIGEIDMWYVDVLGTHCGLVFTADHTINEVVLFFVVGPAGFVSTADIALACAALNDNLANQQAPVAYINGGYPATGDGLPQPSNLTGCFGPASYCDSGETGGLPNACFPAGQPVSGPARATTAVASGGPPADPPAGLGVAVQALELLSSDGNDQTTTFGGQEGGGSLITCCSFPAFP